MRELSIKAYVWLQRGLIGLALLGIVGFSGVVIVLRYWILPEIGAYREDIAAAVSKAAGQRVTIGAIAANWHGIRPHLSLRQVVVFDTQGQPALALDQVENTLSWWSLLAGEVRLHRLEIKSPKLLVRREPDGLIYVSGIVVNRGDTRGGFAEWLLHQEQVVVSHGEIEWQDNLRQAPPLRLEDVGLQIENWGSHHRFGLVATPPPQLASRLDVRGDLHGSVLDRADDWRGTLYSNLGYTDITAWRAWVDFPYRLRQGTGGLQAWAELKHGQLQALTADLRLENVRTQLAKSLPELDLAHLSGRLAWRKLDRGFEIQAKRVSVDGSERIRFPAASGLVRYEAADAKHEEHGEVQVEGVKIEPLVALTDHLPLAPRQRQVLQDISPRGQLKKLSLSWDGSIESPTSYQAKGEIVGVGMNPYGTLPGFANVSGVIEADTKGGNVALAGRHAVFEMPLVFRHPLAFDDLEAIANWRVRDGRVALSIGKVAFSNADIAGSVSGSYQSEPGAPGAIDLSGSLNRANGRAAYIYFPRVVGDDTYDWLKNALVSGSASEVKLRIKGDLKHFPFPDGKEGVFRVTAKGQGVTLDYAPDWPRIENASATLDFQGQRMEIESWGGTISGVRVNKLRASIPDLMHHEELLVIDGEAQGATRDVLGFVARSPVAERIGHFTDRSEAQGDGRLALRIRMPLRKVDATQVTGNYQFLNNTLQLSPDLPAVEQATGKIDFTENAITVPRITARVLGGPASLNVATLPDHSIRVAASGQFSGQALAAAYPNPLTRGLKGTSAWSLGVGMRKGLANVTFATNLQGMASSLPAPFGKAATESLPVKVERRMIDAKRDSISVAVGNVATANLLREADGDAMHVRQGTVRFGGTAPAPSHDGVWLDGALPYFNLDAWRALFVASDSETMAVPLAGLHFKADVFDFLGRRFNDLSVNAWSQGNLWQATIDAGELAGDASWRGDQGGKVTARLKRLTVPEAAPDQGVAPAGGKDLDLPALDVVVEDLQVKKLKLGRLELQAAKQEANWNIEQLKLSNPESVFLASGTWQSWLAQPSTKLDVDLEIKDLSRFLARMGYPDRIKRGTSKLKGNLSWRGGPAAFNLASLSGNLQLEAHSGQFLKVDPGVGKLLGLLSLQSLPRRLTLDFRDVFSEGFAFDNIAGSMTINNGLLASNDFIMQGPAAVVNMAGVTDLVKETQSLRIKVVPGVGEGVAVAGAFLGGPVVGVTAYILQKLLKDPVGQMISYEYLVTGTWDNPEAKKLNQQTGGDKP